MIVSLVKVSAVLFTPAILEVGVQHSGLLNHYIFCLFMLLYGLSAVEPYNVSFILGKRKQNFVSFKKKAHNPQSLEQCLHTVSP